VPRLWRLNPNWNFIIVGAVILIAVVLDQLVHIVQSARRLRAASQPRPPVELPPQEPARPLSG
jgi:hypothetical protein